MELPSVEAAFHGYVIFVYIVMALIVIVFVSHCIVVAIKFICVTRQSEFLVLMTNG